MASGKFGGNSVALPAISATLSLFTVSLWSWMELQFHRHDKSGKASSNDSIQKMRTQQNLFRLVGFLVLAAFVARTCLSVPIWRGVPPSVCKFPMAVYLAAVWSTKIGVHYFFLQRVKIALDNTIFQISHKTLRMVQVALLVLFCSAMLNAVGFELLLDSGKIASNGTCVARLRSAPVLELAWRALNAFMYILDWSLQILLCLTFGTRMNAVVDMTAFGHLKSEIGARNKSGSVVRNENDPLYRVIVRTNVLFVIQFVSSFTLPFLVPRILGIRNVMFELDSFVNFLCVLLQFQVAGRLYGNCCGKCEPCFLGFFAHTRCCYPLVRCCCCCFLGECIYEGKNEEVTLEIR